MNISLKIDGRPVRDFRDFRDVSIVVERSLETYNVSARLESIELYDEDYDYFRNVYETDTFRRIQAELSIGNFVLKGVVDTDSIRIGNRRLVMSLLLDEKSILERDIGGILVRPTDYVFCILERKTDVISAAVLLLASVFYLELALRQIKEIKSELAEAAAVASVGTPSSPFAAALLKASKIIFRLAYLVVIIVAFVEVMKKLLELIPKEVKMPAINFVRAISSALSQSGYSFEVEDEIRKLYLVGKQAQNYEVIELIKLLQDITNTRLVVFNKNVRLVPRAVVPFPFANRAYDEFWRYNTNEIAGLTVISLTPDFTDHHSLDKPQNIEIFYEGIRGYKKIVLPVSPAKVKEEENFFDRVIKNAFEFYRRAAVITKRKLLSFETKRQRIIIGNEDFVPKLVYADYLATLSDAQHDTLMRFIANRYSQTNIQSEVHFARMHLSVQEFLFLAENGWQGVRRLSYNPHREIAEVEYELPASYVLVDKKLRIR